MREEDMPYVDLHIHSTVSDGTLTPESIVRLCRQNGVGALSVTCLLYTSRCV